MSYISKLTGSQRGDTLVEVMLAAAVLSLVLAGAFTITNKATRINQTASERTAVSNAMQREVELIRDSVSSDPDAFWSILVPTTANSNFCDTGPSPSTAASFSAFTINDDLSIKNFVKDIPTDVWQDQDITDNINIWVEAVNDTTLPVEYTDFFVYACWDGIGSEGIQKSGLVLRLSR